jgi:Ca2+/Na+ antiporter
MDNIIILLLSIVFTLICIVLLKINVVRDQVILFVCTLVAFLLFYTIINKINIHKDNEINIMAELDTSSATTVSVDDVVEDVEDVVEDVEDVEDVVEDLDVVNHSLSDIWESTDNPSFHIGK